MWIPIGPETCSEEKSKTGVIVRRGQHMPRHVSCSETLVALSSGETEYYAFDPRSAHKLGLHPYWDWMINVSIDICCDNSAARRCGSGGGLGRLQTRHVKLDVVAGVHIPADTRTKASLCRKVREWSEHMSARRRRSSHSDEATTGKTGEASHGCERANNEDRFGTPVVEWSRKQRGVNVWWLLGGSCGVFWTVEQLGCCGPEISASPE